MMAENAYGKYRHGEVSSLMVCKVGEAELHASVGGTEENNLAIPDHERQH